MTKEERREYYRAWRKANHEKCKARSKAWREANPEKAKALVKAAREANPEKYKAALKSWRKANHEKCKVRDKAWKTANPEKVKYVYINNYSKHQGITNIPESLIKLKVQYLINKQQINESKKHLGVYSPAAA